MSEETLECQRCRARQQRSLDEEDLRALHLDGSTLLFCPQCRQETPWGYFSRERRRGRDRRSRPRVEPAPPAKAEKAVAPPVTPLRTGDPLEDLTRSFLEEKRSSPDRRAIQQRIHPRAPLQLLARVSAQTDGVFQEITRTTNVSRSGVYFQSEYPYQRNQPVAVQLSYSEVMKDSHTEKPGVVVRIDLLPASVGRGIAVKLN